MKIKTIYIGPKLNRVKKGLILQHERTQKDIEIQGTSGAGTPAEHDGIAFEDLPEDWKCPRCKQGKEKFNRA